MRTSLLRSLVLLAASPVALLAQEAERTRQFMKPDTGLMVWTLIIFVVPHGRAVPLRLRTAHQGGRAREETLQEAIDGAKRDRDAAAKLLAEHQAKIEAARGEAQKLIADGRAVAEKMRADLLEQTRKEQQDMLERARREIESEKDEGDRRSFASEAVDLALAGASKVIEQNLESPKNRQLVESIWRRSAPSR